MMSEIPFVVGDADAGLAERLDKEINSFNAAATGHHDGRMLSVAVRGGDGDERHDGIGFRSLPGGPSRPPSLR